LPLAVDLQVSLDSLRLVNVLHVTHFPVFGGPHNQALRLSAPLAARGFRTVVVLPSEPGNAAERLRAGNVDVRVVPLHRIRNTPNVLVHARLAIALPNEVSKLRALIRSEQIDLVQVAGLVNPHAAIAARLERIPVVWQLLDTRAPIPVAMAAMVWVRALADTVMTTGVAVAKWHPGYEAIKERVIPYFPPVDLDRFTPLPGLRAGVRADWGIAMSDPVVGCVANVNPQKGILELVKAFASLRQGHPDARLVLVGAEYATHADYSAAVRVEMASHGLADGRDVLFLGAVSDVERQLAGMDVVALSAVPRSEGITTAILEAMAAGLPVVVTDVGGIREAVHDGISGIVVAPNDPAAFSVALVRLLADPALRTSIGAAARRAAEARFGVDTCVETHIRAYRHAQSRQGRSSVPVVATPYLRPSRNARIVDGIAVFVEADRTSHDEVDHQLGGRQKQEQVRHFDRIDEEEFETNRPRGTPRLYRFLLGKKFQLAIDPIRTQIIGASALTVCGGSGMDAEFLARAGAVVTSSDLSLGAASRAKTRFAKWGVNAESVVADVEDLPYGDESIDLVSVHDGLHHLGNPYSGLAEMARVARHWIVVSEPARASVTRWAVRLRLALETEPAGNRVARLDPAEVSAYLAARGFVVLRADRYAMYYPHHPGRVFKALSWPVVYQVTRIGWQIANRAIGRFGNKMLVVARRASHGNDP
jgi:glycosyltransferase involved in cell wall biosynthesis/SAM-dependent methyltransferase